MKLEVGMYVRTKEGNIEKICAIENEHIYTDEDYLSWYPSHNAINKASHNIIDLIEVGDYVNWNEVMNKELNFVYTHNRFGNRLCLKETDIKSIVTKEMFSSVEYRVEIN